MRSTLLIGALTLLAALGAPSNANAADTAPPQLVEFDFAPKTVDVAYAPAEITVTMRLTDNDSGVVAPYFLFASQSTSQQAGFAQTHRVSGNSLDGVYQTTVSLPVGAAPGKWRASLYPLRDSAGNSNDSFGPPSPFPSELDVENDPGGNPADLDVSFDDDGKFTRNPDLGFSAYARSAVPQPDGKLLVAGDGPTGTDAWSVTRLLENGTPDASFAGDGHQETSFISGDGPMSAQAMAVAREASGRILVGGQGGSQCEAAPGGGQTCWMLAALARYDEAGSLDTTFGSDGRVLTRLSVGSGGRIIRVLPQSDGRVIAVAAANSQSTIGTVVLRYEPDGSLDETFGNGGQLDLGEGNPGGAVQLDGGAIAITAGMSDGTVAVSLITPDGAPVPGFGAMGRVVLSGPFGSWATTFVAAHDDGALIVGSEGAMWRLLDDGQVDASFAINGRLASQSRSVAVDSGGHITGASSSGATARVWRYLPDGSSDPNFGSNGAVTTPLDASGPGDVREVLIDNDDRPMVLGVSSHFGSCCSMAVLRYRGGDVPDTEITSGPGEASTSGPHVLFAFASQPSGPDFECKLDDGGWAACNSPVVLDGLSDGGHRFEVRAVTSRGNLDASPAVRTFMVDTTPPQTAVDSGPSGSTNESTPTFEFSSTEDGATLECRLDGPGATSGSYAGCTSPHTLTTLIDGTYMLSVRATDAAGNTDSTPASRSFTVDTNAPQTTIDTGPSGATNDVTPTFELSSEAGASFECRLDGPGASIGSYASCSSPKSYAGLTDGAYTFLVRAIDAAGNTDSSSASRIFNVDTAAPQTSIDSGPTGDTNDTTPSFGFSSDAGSTFECKLDGPGASTGSYVSCAAPKTYATLADGDYTFSVRATDVAGNTDPTPASRSFSVDTAAPQTTIDSGPTGGTNDTTPSFGFSATEAGSFECKLDGPGASTGSYASCGSPKSYAALADGSYVLTVRATDAASNADATPASRSFTVDTAAPQTTIDSGPTGATGDSSPSFGFSSEAGASFECKLDGPGASTRSYTSCGSPRTYAALADGDYTVAVRATDTVGNTDVSPALRSFTIDTAAPQTTIDSGPTGPTNDTTPTFDFSSEADASFECKLDGPGANVGSYASCSSPKSYAALAVGSYVLSVRGFDGAGNPDPTPASRSFTVDTNAPQTTIDIGPTGGTNDTTPSFEFSSEAGSSFECNLDGPGASTGNYTSCTSPKTTASLADGTYTFSVRATDAAGNADPTPASRGFTVDTSAPQTTIDGGPSGVTTNNSPSFSFSAEAGATFECSMDEGSWATCASPKTYVSVADGQHTFRVRAVDTAGNADPSEGTRTFVVDTSPPQTTVDAGPPAATSDPTPTFAFSATESNSSFECRVDDASFTACDSPKTLATLADGSHTFDVRAIDAAGTTDPTPASRGFIVDTAAPQTTIDAGPTGATADGSPDFGFSSEAGARFECRLDAAPWGACGSPISYSSLAAGPHTFHVRATDGASNTDPTEATRSFTVETAPSSPGPSGDPGSGPNPAGDPPSGGNVSRLVVGVSVKKTRLRTLIAKGLKVRTSCSRSCTVRIQLQLDRKTAKKLKINQLVGVRTIVVTGSGAAKVVVKLKPKSKRALKRLRRAKFVLRVSGTDSTGTPVAPLTRAIALKR